MKIFRIIFVLFVLDFLAERSLVSVDMLVDLIGLSRSSTKIEAGLGIYKLFSSFLSDSKKEDKNITLLQVNIQESQTIIRNDLSKNFNVTYMNKWKIIDDSHLSAHYQHVLSDIDYCSSYAQDNSDPHNHVEWLNNRVSCLLQKGYDHNDITFYENNKWL
jgi:hypothetical protein